MVAAMNSMYSIAPLLFWSIIVNIASKTYKFKLLDFSSFASWKYLWNSYAEIVPLLFESMLKKIFLSLLYSSSFKLVAK